MNCKNKLNALGYWLSRVEQVTAICTLLKPGFDLSLLDDLKTQLTEIADMLQTNEALFDSDPIILGIMTYIKMLQKRCDNLKSSMWQDRFVDTGRKSVDIAVDVVAHAFDFRQKACMPPELIQREIDPDTAITNVLEEIISRTAYPVCAPGKNIIRPASIMIKSACEKSPENASNPFFDVCVWCKLFFAKVGFDDVAEQKKQKCQCFGQDVYNDLAITLSKTARYATHTSDRADRSAFLDALNAWESV
jgi:hypothetical protein